MKLLLKAFIILFLTTSSSFAASIIRDVEIESVLREIADPIFDAADLTHDSINLYIVNDEEINAYVSGGSNVFVNTGLLSLSDEPYILTGVLAHETGHIAGGHLVRSSQEFKSTALKATLGYMVGLAAAAAGSPQAGVAIAQGAGHVAQRQMLKHTRTHEESADQAALTYLEKIGQSSRGLLELLELLYNKETTLYNEINPYTLTHPLSRERISHVRSSLKTAKSADAKVSPKLLKNFKRAIVKLNAFLQPYDKTLNRFPLSDKSVEARYARAIAYYKIPDIEKSLKEIDELIALEPDNPFFNELKGQILFENGKVMESIPFYKKALKLLPDSALLKIILATAQISSEDEAMRKKAIGNLKQALLTEKENGFAWHQLAIAYGRGGDLGMSNLALAEEAFITDDKKSVRKFLDIAKKHIKAGTPADLRIHDMLGSLDSE